MRFIGFWGFAFLWLFAPVRKELCEEVARENGYKIKWRRPR